MKTFAITLLLCGATFAAGYVIGSKHSVPQPTPAVAAAEPAVASPEPSSPPREVALSKPERTPAAPVAASEPAPAAPVETPAPVAARETPALSPAVAKALDTLVSPQSSIKDKQTALKEVIEAGQLDQTIEALKNGAAQNTNSPAWQSALGQALLQKAGVLSRSGGNQNEMGIVAMQADQSFDTALKLDPANWDAQYLKAVALSHWPAELNRGDEVVQRLSKLIDQQDLQSPQPQFAQTYAVLGEQYQKMGKTDYAMQTWKLGLQKFPSNPTLLKKVSGQ